MIVLILNKIKICVGVVLTRTFNVTGRAENTKTKSALTSRNPGHRLPVSFYLMKSIKVTAGDMHKSAIALSVFGVFLLICMSLGRGIIGEDGNPVYAMLP